jgi:hypothetical protein
MSIENVHKSIVRYLAVFVTMMLLVSGCSTLSQNEEDSATQPAAEQKKEETPLYYDFGDVPVPPELKLSPKSSFVYRTQGFSAGVLVLKGRVDVGSLITFLRIIWPEITGRWSALSSLPEPCCCSRKKIDGV